MCVTFLLAILATYIPSILVQMKNVVMDKKVEGPKKNLEKNIGVKSLAKVLYVCKNRRNNVERAVWSVIENGNKQLKDRVFDEYALISNQQYLEN